MMLTISSFGEAAVDRKLLRFSGMAADASPAFEAIADMFYASEKRQFDTEGAWASGGWAPLAQSTVDEKARHADWDQRILHRTLRLRLSLTDPDAPDAVRQISAEEMVLASTVPYGVYHQQPAVRSGWLPMRKPVEVPEATKRSMVVTMQRFLVYGEL